jgi:hypothetical protein
MIHALFMQRLFILLFHRCSQPSILLRSHAGRGSGSGMVGHEGRSEGPRTGPQSEALLVHVTRNSQIDKMQVITVITGLGKADQSDQRTSYIYITRSDPGLGSGSSWLFSCSYPKILVDKQQRRMNHSSTLQEHSCPGLCTSWTCAFVEPLFARILVFSIGTTVSYYTEA